MEGKHYLRPPFAPPRGCPVRNLTCRPAPLVGCWPRAAALCLLGCGPCCAVGTSFQPPPHTICTALEPASGSCGCSSHSSSSTLARANVCLRRFGSHGQPGGKSWIWTRPWQIRRNRLHTCSGRGRSETMSDWDSIKRHGTVEHSCVSGVKDGNFDINYNNSNVELIDGIQVHITAKRCSTVQQRKP